MVAPTTASMAQGTNRMFVVTLVRSNFLDPITVGLSSTTPAPITSAPLSVSGSSGQLQLTVGAAQPVGPVDLFVEASSGTLREVALLHLDVTDGVAPSIVSTTPAHQALGVRNDATVTVRFSEAMNTTTTQQAFSSDLGAVAFAWNAAHTELTVTPMAPLTYSALNAMARQYAFHFAATATDVAGNALSTTTPVSFSTLRTTEVLLSSVAVSDGYLIDDRFNSGTATAMTTNPNLLVGDTSLNRQLTSWLTFDLALVPVARASDLLESELVLPLSQTIGTINASLCASINSCVMVSPVNYGPQLSMAAYATTLAPRQPMAPMMFGTFIANFKRTVLADTVAAWNDRGARSNRLQFEVELASSNNGNSTADYFEFISGDGSQATCPYLRVTALLP